MVLLYCDETNLVANPGAFFVYGGLSVPSETALDLSTKVDAIRKKFHVPDEFKLKFNPGPAGLNNQQFIELKQNVISAAVESNCELYVSIILHDIAKDVNEARRNEINRICFHFNCSLKRNNDVGLVLIDRFEDQKIDGHLREKFSLGLRNMPYCDSMRLDKIVGFHYSAIGQSNFPSIIDIIIGSFRLCINEHTANPNEISERQKAILGLISPLFPRETTALIPETHLFFSPKIIKVGIYRDQYTSLSQFFTSVGICPDQSISAERTY